MEGEGERGKSKVTGLGRCWIPPMMGEERKTYRGSEGGELYMCVSVCTYIMEKEKAKDKRWAYLPFVVELLPRHR
jgi:hypothetical protein